MDVDPGCGFSSPSLEKLIPLSTHNSYWSLLDEAALSSTFPLTERVDEKTCLCSRVPSCCCQGSVMPVHTLRLFLAVPEMPTWKSAADAASGQYQGLAVSQCRSWAAAHPRESVSGQQTGASRSHLLLSPPLPWGALLVAQGADGAASPSSSTSPDVTRSFLLSLQSSGAFCKGTCLGCLVSIFSLSKSAYRRSQAFTCKIAIVV